MLHFHLNLSDKNINDIRYELDKARKKGDLKTVNRLTAILSIGSGYDLDTVSDIIQVSYKTVYQWMTKYFIEGVSGLINKKKIGRPPKLIKTQRKQILSLIKKGPESSGFSGSCWRSPMIQELILLKFKVFS